MILHSSLHLILISTLWVWYNHCHFPGEATEAYRGCYLSKCISQESFGCKSWSTNTSCLKKKKAIKSKGRSRLQAQMNPGAWVILYCQIHPPCLGFVFSALTSFPADSSHTMWNSHHSSRTYPTDLATPGERHLFPNYLTRFLRLTIICSSLVHLSSHSPVTLPRDWNVPIGRS